MKHQIESLGWPLTAEVIWLDDGADVGLFGGCRTHVGAVTLMGPEGSRTMTLKDDLNGPLSQRWAGMLTRLWQVPVSVRCGIDYPLLSEEQQRTLMNDAERLLYQVINMETPSAGDL